MRRKSGETRTQAVVLKKGVHARAEAGTAGSGLEAGRSRARGAREGEERRGEADVSSCDGWGEKWREEVACMKHGAWVGGGARRGCENTVLQLEAASGGMAS